MTEETTRSIPHAKAPCVLHRTHSPITVINELHHVFPMEWQRAIWGEVRDKQTISVCSTGHNNIHEAHRIHKRTGEFPTWCVGETREWAAEGLRRRQEAQGTP